MGTLLNGSYFRSLRFLALASLVVLSISMQILAQEDPQSGDDGDGEDTAFARSSISRIQI
jgi:hypothetical protein